MRFGISLSALIAAVLVACGPVLAQESTPIDERRSGPFVMTDASLGALLEDGFEVKGMLGGAIVLVKDATLYSCALEPDTQALSYKTRFACSVLDEITPQPTSEQQ